MVECKLKNILEKNQKNINSTLNVLVCILFFIIILLALGIAYLVPNLGININEEAINSFFQRFGILIVVCLLILMYYISYRISYKIFRNKEN